MKPTLKTSRKRKQSSSPITSPFTGVITRQKSQHYFFNRNRSGKCRVLQLSSPKITPPQCDGDGSVQDVCRVSIKDLRTRRVFSKPPEEKSLGKIDTNPNHDFELIDERLGCSHEMSPASAHIPFLLASEKCGVGFGFDEVGLVCGDTDVSVLKNPNLGVDGRDSELSLSAKKCDDSVVDRNPGMFVAEKCDSRGRCDSAVDCDDSIPNDEILGDVVVSSGASNDEIHQTTPQEAMFSIKKNDGQNVLQNRSFVSRSLTKPTSPTKDGSAGGKRNLSNSKRNMTLNLCSKLKVYKTPSSFSYRRLLPFLMDMAKDEPCTSKSDPTVKIEAEVERKPAVPISNESNIDDPKLVGMPLVNETAFLLRETKTDRIVEFSPEPIGIDTSTQEGAAQRPITNDPNTPSVTLQRCNTSAPCTQLAAVQCPETSDTAYQRSHMQMPIDCSTVIVEKDVVSRQISTGEANVRATSDTLRSSNPTVGVAEGRTTGLDIAAEKSPSQSSSKLAVCVYSGAPGGDPLKGILRRNPRGCRGNCSCLNCTSFRLNAEKAFEFSRNQLLEAEQVAEDLMKEISNLRYILGRSHTLASDHAIISLNLVEETCRRASNVEDKARSRLIQMKEDLYVHCRTKTLERPRVNFSD